MFPLHPGPPPLAPSSFPSPLPPFPRPFLLSLAPSSFPSPLPPPFPRPFLLSLPPRPHACLQVCVPGGDKRRGEGFSKADNPTLWQDARIPAIVVEFEDALRIRKNLGVV
jgi:hypothetical protein